VVVTVAATTGEAGYGGWAAGPVFVNVMNEALRRMGVPRDVPEEIEELEAKERSTEKDRKKQADDVSLAYLSTPLTAEEMQAASGEGLDDASGNEGADTQLDANGPKAPDFTGKTVKDVMTEAAASNLDVEMLGDGLARSQNPPAGSVLSPGERIRVRFAR